MCHVRGHNALVQRASPSQRCVVPKTTCDMHWRMVSTMPYVVCRYASNMQMQSSALYLPRRIVIACRELHRTAVAASALPHQHLGA
jgi:hypothetical protein